MPDKPPEKLYLTLRDGLWVRTAFGGANVAEYILASQVAAEIAEKVWEQVGVVLSGFTSREIRKVDLIAALEAERTADIEKTESGGEGIDGQERNC